MMKKHIALILCIFTLAFCAAGCGNGANNADSSAATADSASKTEEAFTISTAAGDFYFPAKWKDTAEAKVDENGLTMYYKDNFLFEISFVDNKGTNIGTYNGKDIYVSSAEVKKGKMSDSDYNTALMIQDDINFMLKKLEVSPGFSKKSN